jgi:small GTP-binding protein
VLFLGCIGSGKTSLLYHLKLGSFITTIPTIGFNTETIEFNDVEINIWDIGGSGKIKSLWYHYFENTKLVVYIVFDQLEESKADIEMLLNDKNLKDVPFLILLNRIEMSSLSE